MLASSTGRSASEGYPSIPAMRSEDGIFVIARPHLFWSWDENPASHAVARFGGVTELAGICTEHVLRAHLKDTPAIPAMTDTKGYLSVSFGLGHYKEYKNYRQ